MGIIGMVLILIAFIGFFIFVKGMMATLNNLILGKSVKERLKVAIIGGKYINYCVYFSDYWCPLFQYIYGWINRIKMVGLLIHENWNEYYGKYQAM